MRSKQCLVLVTPPIIWSPQNVEEDSEGDSSRLGAQVTPFVCVAPEVHRNMISFLMGVGAALRIVSVGAGRGLCSCSFKAVGSTQFPAGSWTMATVLPWLLDGGFFSFSFCGETLEHAHMTANGFLERMRMRTREMGGGRGRHLLC